MSDEQNVETGSEATGEQPAPEVEAAPAEAPSEAPAPEVDAEQTPAEGSDSTAEDANPDANESRTGFVTNARPGDECTCPDGRTGTVHKFDEGLVCIPNAEQGN
jgi:hypothetical protein